MYKNKTTVISCLLATGLLATSGSAVAKGTVIGKVGTLGGGLEYVYPINSKLAIGLGANGFSYSESLEESDIDYDADLDMQSFSLVGDYHPFGNGFRLSAGIYSNGNEFSLVGTPTGDDEVFIGDNPDPYTAEDLGSLEALIGFKSTAPYLGIGWGKVPNGKGWGFDADLGVLFQGSPEVSLTATCADDVVCDELEDDIAAEEASLAVDAEDFEMFPVISLGVSYSF